MPSNREALALLLFTGIALLWSGISPAERDTWVMEVAPIFIGVPVLLATYKRFRPTRLFCWLVAIHSLILMVGGHYTYAKVPAGFWVQELFGFTRNHYDRLGHIAQGFIPAILAREVLLKTSPLRRGKWLFFLVVCVCMAVSALYELIEWWAALALGQGATAFLGTQGDEWDSQWDMFLALVGALSSLILLSRLHDRQLETQKQNTVC